jgi:hypothetical protein
MINYIIGGLESFENAVQPALLNILNIFLFKINIFLVFLDCFDALI